VVQICTNLLLVVLDFFPPLGMPCSSDSNLLQSGEEGTPSKNAKNALMDVKEEEAIIAVARALNGEDVPTSKKRGRPSKGGKASVPPKKKKVQQRRHQRRQQRKWWIWMEIQARKEKDLLESGEIMRSKHQ
jgi:hypothetical protein